MDILQLIKKRRTIRKYKDSPVPKKIIDKILEAGRWAPSAHNLQPWYFVVLESRESREKVVSLLKNPSGDIFTGIRIIIKKNAEIIEKSPVIILVFNTLFFSKKAKEFGELYFNTAHVSEIESVSAAIQNMHLIATSLGVGMAWFTIPLLVAKGIENNFDYSGELLAILTLGYPAEKAKVTLRKPTSEIIKYIN